MEIAADVTTVKEDKDAGKIECQICHAKVHSIKIHIEREHATEWTFAKYQLEFPGAPTVSEKGRQVAEEARAKKAAEDAAKAAAEAASGRKKEFLHSLFGLGNVKAAMSTRSGQPIPITVLTAPRDPEMVPDVDDNYVYDIDSLKNILMAIEMRIPVYVWGHAGTGKTTILEQIAAHTGRPMLRVQHTANTEESHILGQWTARGGETHFELGPLALAMLHGWAYLADEYDFAAPSVLAVYQPILEGKSLVIKEADHQNRVIHPHPDFRFFATGNTNGSGDETGLYQGTAIQNAANYDRFGVVLQMHYMKADLEIQILVNQAGISKPDATKIVEFATRIREQYDGNKISNTISPRTLINAAKIGMLLGSYRKGIALSFGNKLSKVDQQVIDGVTQRIFT